MNGLGPPFLSPGVTPPSAPTQRWPLTSPRQSGLLSFPLSAVMSQKAKPRSALGQCLSNVGINQSKQEAHLQTSSVLMSRRRCFIPG